MSRLLATAVVCLSLAPPQHIHRAGIEGRQDALVHAHAPQAARGHETSGGAALETFHGDHRLAIALSTDSISPPRISLSPDVAMTGAFVFPPDDAVSRIGDIFRGGSHGPPGPAITSRGPPPVI